MNTTPTDNESNDPTSAPRETTSLPTRSIVTIAIVAVVLLGVLGVGVALTRGGSSSADTAGETTTTTAASPSTTKQGSTGTTAVPCAQGTWPKAFAGKPDGLTQASAAAFFIWSDNSGFHIRGIDPLATTPFSGTITVGNTLTDAAIVNKTSDAVTATVANNVISFSFEASGLAAGFDFSLCQAMQASIAVNSGTQQWPAQRILIGSNGRAVANPVLLNRS